MLKTLVPEIVMNVRFADLVPKFLELRRAELDTLSDAINASDFSTVARIGHNLHGSGASYSLEALSEMGALIENAAYNQDTVALYQEYAGLVNFLESVQISYRSSILFVDDQPEILSLLHRLFGEDEYICYFASSGSQALEILDEHPVDVLVSDLVMPEMSGLELLRVVRQRHPHIVRLVLSGQSQVPSILAAIKTGQVFRYLTKPWRVDSEARQTIAEAVQHANEINHQAVPQVQMAMDTLLQVLTCTGAEFVLTGGDKRVIHSSNELRTSVGIQQGQAVPSQALMSAGVAKIVLDQKHTLWVLHS